MTFIDLKFNMLELHVVYAALALLRGNRSVGDVFTEQDVEVLHQRVHGIFIGDHNEED
jgi:hypothetical protein